jgi:hypothetical protein
MTATTAATAVLAVLGLLLGAGASAGAAGRGPWATVNVCDTAGHPDGVGIRGSMPGGGPRVRLRMRFVVQFRGAGGRWRPVGAAGDSGWVDAGSAGARGSRQAGRTFTVTPPASGGTYLLRGVVRFEWRRGKQVVRRGRVRTRAGHPGTAGADPPSFSAATCVVR